MQRDDRDHCDLTPREREVLSLARMGMTNREIAERLGITRNAVRFHLKDIHSKLETGSQRNALVRAFDRGSAWLALPIGKLGAPLTTALFAGGIAVTAIAAYRSLPGEPARASVPARFEGTITVAAGTATPAPGRFEGAVTADLTPSNNSAVPFFTSLISGRPAGGAVLRQADTRTTDPARPRGVCASIRFSSGAPDARWYRMTFDGMDVTNRLTWVVLRDQSGGEMCYAPEVGFEPGAHSVEVVVRDPQGSSGMLKAVWDFTVLP